MQRSGLIVLLTLTGLTLLILSISIPFQTITEDEGPKVVVVYGFTGEIIYRLTEGKLPLYVLSLSGDHHGFELTSQEVSTLSRAEYLVAFDVELDNWVKEVLRGFPHLKAVYVTDLVGERLDHGWLSPGYHVRSLEAIAGWVSKAYPHLRDTVMDRKGHMLKEYKDLEDRYRSSLEEAKGRWVLVEYGSLATIFEGFGLNVVYVKSQHEEEMTIGKINEVIDAVRRHGIKTLFVEKGSKDPVIERLRSELGLRVYEIDLLEDVTLNDLLIGNGYVERMTTNLMVIEEGLRR
ncbi:MAG: zinc ABC transporter substrate-binding protein [Aigarchaeota archaeon]|nr:zinc ABC transporter substrate-binding protein [Aigarchaeota archaeon]MDW8093279.1 metal ABC transporter substrate-binding protein [Nitrososphaerota archaeon]